MDLADEFVALPAHHRAAVVAHAIHYETINARGIHVYRPQDADGLYNITERIHRLATGVIHALSDEEDKGRWVFELILKSASIPVGHVRSWVYGKWVDG